MDSYPAEPTENTVECVKHVLCESSSEHEPVESSELSSLTSPCKKVKPKLNRILMKKAVLSAIATKARQTEQAYQFFSDNQFSRRFCAKFYSDNRDPEVCKGCGFPENEHVKILSPLNRWAADSLEWKPDFHLINEPYPNETLKIRLVDEPAGIDKSADLMIIADNTHPGMPVQVLVERWKVPVPDFIVSVIGTTHESPVTPEQFQYFKPDFNRAVSSSNVWVIGGGSLHGVDKLVSECLKEVQLQAWMGLSSKKLDVIGIVNWDCFESNHAANTLYFGSEYPMSRFSPDQKFSYFVKKRRPDWDAQTGKLSFTLNPLFTNFIAIQGGVKGKLHQETNLRSSIENLLSNPLLEKSLLENTKTIPQTLVVLGGDVGTLDHIANSLINGIPAVLCQGSGGITDVIIGALRMTKGIFFSSLAFSYLFFMLHSSNKTYKNWNYFSGIFFA
ncbi:transient receptor potential cation channel subfamily M member 2-like [Symsagittifera roscoffensis]|uniref:transient receptor potential cation channel subfamily M member 2-like n=1 Tax=Symsagittifera roscoffensis TaxID=84072 RepID=UPI00307C0DAA